MQRHALGAIINDMTIPQLTHGVVAGIGDREAADRMAEARINALDNVRLLDRPHTTRYSAGRG